MPQWPPNRQSSYHPSCKHRRKRCKIPIQTISSEQKTLGCQKLTGGISFGSSTSFVMVVFPFLIGHSRSTLETCSQSFASVLTSLINPYLTCRMTLAPSSISSSNVPTASMLSVLPLDKDQLVEQRCVTEQVYIRLRRVWRQIDVFKDENIIIVVFSAV